MVQQARHKFGWVVLGAAIASLIAGGAQAAIVNDTFGDNDYNNDGTADAGTPTPAAAGADTLDVAWYSHNATRTVADDTGLASGNELFVSGPNGMLTVGTLYGANSQASAASLTLSTGETAVLAFDIRLIATTASNLRFGLYNSRGTAITADNNTNNFASGTSTVDNDTGFWALVPVNNAAANAELNRDNGTDSVLGGTGQSRFALVAGAGNVANTTAVHFEFRVTRTSDTEALVQVVKDGVTVLSATSTGVPNTGYFTFDEIAIQSGNAANDFYLDNVTLVPEPASLGLLGLGGLVMAGRRHSA